MEFFYRSYASFQDRTQVAVRERAFGEDIGQNSWVTTEEYGQFLRFLRLERESSVLEVASGSGGPAVYIARKTGCRLTGLDADANGVAAAVDAAARAGLRQRVSFQQADATRPLPFPDEFFDALVCIDSMNHFTDRERLLQEWGRVLRPGARAVFTDPVVITGPVTNHELAQRSAIGTFVFVPRGWNEEQIVKTGFRLVSQLNASENAAMVSNRWREAREHFRQELIRLEGDASFQGTQTFLDAVHRLSAGGRLSRVAYFVEKPANEAPGARPDSGRRPAVRDSVVT